MSDIWIGVAISKNRNNSDDFIWGPFSSPQAFQERIKTEIKEREYQIRIYDSYTLDLYRPDGMSDILTHIQYDQNCDEIDRFDLNIPTENPKSIEAKWVAFLLPRFSEDGEKIIGIYSSFEEFEKDLVNIQGQKYLWYAKEFSSGFAIETHNVNHPHEENHPAIRREYNLNGELTRIILEENGEQVFYKQEITQEKKKVEES